jgi:NAD(P)-dependent dehydrogenase (short-subunit alcohol dehydrogenase family)
MPDKIAIVTGAAGNLGQAVVKKFLAGGYAVIGTMRSNDDAKDIAGDKFEKAIVDLTDDEASSDFIQSVIKKYGRIDVAVLTAGGFAMGSLEDTTFTDIMQQYSINFETAYNVGRPAFLQMMKQNSGRIFFIGSKAGLSAKEGKAVIAYGLTKSLVIRLAELMNEEAKGHDVVTAVIVPGTIDTPQNRKSMPDADPEKWVKAESIADILYFHCTDQAAAIREPVIKIYNHS